MEMYTIGQDDMLGNTPPQPNPEPIERRRKDCASFFRHAHGVVSLVLNRLDDQLDLPEGTLAARSPLNKPSATSLRLLLSPPQKTSEEDFSRITLPGHTDIGTITLLFHVVGGLQILPFGSSSDFSNWRYVRPEPGCALVNLGDTIVEWTGGILKSSLHRVIAAPGAQGKVPRISLAYLVRASNEEDMRRLKGGKVIPSLSESESEVEDTRLVNDWAAWRARQIMDGVMRPQTNGGRNHRG
jgi:isopenicillin N synthase-like dioxygenase